VCDRHQFYPRSICTGCRGSVEWVVASGKGEVYFDAWSEEVTVLKFRLTG
jgi:uncharacterized OB-fold protein